MTGPDTRPAAVPAAAGALESHWRQLVTTALLGTDRRDPPVPPPGPVADLVADAVRSEPSARMLADVAATAAVRRAAFVAGPPAAPLAPPPPDPRPPCPPEATATWRYVIDEWPVLEDEWMLAVLTGGWRLPPDVAASALASHRRDTVRRARVALAAGPVAGWLLDHVPDLRPAAGGRDGAPSDAQVRTLPELAIPPDLAPLVGADAHTFVTRLLPRFHDGLVGPAHRPVLEHLVARCRPEVLLDAAAALDTVDRFSHSSGVAHVLADLARTRARMLAELAPPGVTGRR